MGSFSRNLSPRSHRSLRPRTPLIECLEDRRLLSASTSGAIDRAFGAGGLASVLPAGTAWTNTQDVTVTRGGKIVIVGSAQTAGGSAQLPALVRLNADGSADTSFGTAGVVLTNFGSGFSYAEATRVGIDAQGKIVIAGDADGAFIAARYNADGSLDATFGHGGEATAALGPADGSGTVLDWGLAFQADGKIVVAGQSEGQAAVVRFSADGALDSSFGNKGEVLTPAPGATGATDGSSPTLDGAGGVSVLRDGRLLVVSGEAAGDGSGRIDFLYYTASGGLAALDQGPVQDSAPQVTNFVALRSGQVLTFGSDGTDAVERHNADASLDPSFANQGVAGGVLDWVSRGAVDAEGHILLVGSGSIGTSGNQGLGVARFNADGSADAAFGLDGKIVSTRAGYGVALAAARDGSVVAAGGDGSAFDAVRLLPNAGVTRPVATLVSAPVLTQRGATQATVTVTYSGGDGVDPSSTDDSDLAVTDAAGNSLPAYFQSQTVSADGSVTVTYQVQKDYAGHKFNSDDNGVYTIALNDGEVYDVDGVPAEAKTLGTLSVNIAVPPGGIVPPTATLAAADLAAVNVTDPTFRITYRSGVGIDDNTIDDNTIDSGTVAVTGPDGSAFDATAQSVHDNADGSVTVKYSFSLGQHQTFTPAQNGTWTVSIDGVGPTDQEGTPVAAAALGTFGVNVPAVPTGAPTPTASLRADDWTDPSVASEELKVTYKGATPIALNTLDDYDIAVDGPGGYHQLATFVQSAANADGSVTADYQISRGYFHPGPVLPVTVGTPVLAGGVHAAVAKSPSSGGKATLFPVGGGLGNGTGLAHGTYTVSLASGQVNDAAGAAAAATSLGTFRVNLPPEPVIPQPLGGGVSLLASGRPAGHGAATTLSGVAAKLAPVRAHAAHHRRHHHHHHHPAAKSAAAGTTTAARHVNALNP